MRKLSNEEALPQFEWAPGSRELLKVKRTLLPLPSSADRKFVKELPEEPSLPEVIVEVTVLIIARMLVFVASSYRFLL